MVNDIIDSYENGNYTQMAKHIPPPKPMKVLRNGVIVDMFVIPNVTRNGYVWGFGNELWDTLDEAIENLELNVIRSIKRFQSEDADEREEYERQEYERTRPRTPLEIYTADMTPMQRGRIVKTLTKKYVFNGRVMSRQEFIEKAIRDEGYVVSHRHCCEDEMILISPEDSWYERRVITKMGIDYAIFLEDYFKGEIDGATAGNKN